MKLSKTEVHALRLLSINEYIGKHASRRGNSILIVVILSIKTWSVLYHLVITSKLEMCTV